jgi:sec-independent protein translocase protein TatB
MGIHPTIEVATVSMWDTFILMIMALVVFGPRRLPKIGRQIGKLMYEFRKASNDFRFQMEEELRNAEEADRRQREETERQRALAAAAQSPVQIEAPAEPAESSGVSPTGQSEENSAGNEPEDRSPYDEAAYEHYQRGAAAAESEPEPAGLRVKPPETGAPVPAEPPTSRASAAPPEAAANSGAPEVLPSGDEAAVSNPHDLSTETPAHQMPQASETAAETEPATHHG